MSAPHGEIYVGAYLLVVGAREGALVSTAAPEVRPHPTPRPGPFRVLPPRVSHFVGRQTHAEATLPALSTSRPVEFFGDEGAGKSSLLSHLGHTLVLASHPGGTLALSAARASLDDIAQGVFDLLFTSDHRIKVSSAALRQRLSEQGAARALILIDDVELEPEGVEALGAATQPCALVFTSLERLLWSEGRAEALEGLDPDDAAALFERTIGGHLDGDERAQARTLAALLGGRPLSIVLAAGVTRTEVLSPLEVQSRIATAGSIEAVAIEPLAGDELRMASALAALGGADASTEDLVAIAATVDPRAALDGLSRRGVVRRAENRCGMPQRLVAEMRRRADLGEWERRASSRYTDEALRRGTDPAWVAAESVVLLEVLDRAALARRWPDALALARAIESGAALSGRWGVWGHVLEVALQAARHGQDVAAEAWALHQRGTRALCLGAADAARVDLEDALVLRDETGDSAGAVASRRNLEHVPGEPVFIAAGPPEPAVMVQRAGPSPWFFLALALAGIALLTIVILAVTRDDEAAGPMLVVGTGPVEYGARAIGVTGDPRVIVIENQSDESSLVRAVRIEGGAAGDFVVLRDDCTGRTLAPAEGCTIVAAFVPTATGARFADLVLEEERGTRTVTLSGTGTALVSVSGATEPGGIEVTPARVDFGTQPVETTAGPLPITFVNGGTGSARPVLRLQAGPSREFSIVDDLCTNSVVPPGEACIVQVAFRPRGAGLRGAVLTVRDAVTNDTWTVALTGTGALEASAGTTPGAPAGEAAGPVGGSTLAGPDAISFGFQQPGIRSMIQSVGLENTTDDEVRVSSVRLSGLDAATFGLANDRCSGSILRPGGRCNVDVWFRPVDEGDRSASLVVRDGSGEVGREIVLTGTGR